MELIQSIIENSNFPVLTAFLLGLIVALHPCPLATNVAAMGYLAKDVHDGKRVFIRGLAYTVGRIVAYSVLGIAVTALLKGSADISFIGKWFGEWGERLLAPVLVIIGLYFIFSVFIHKEEHCPDVSARGHKFRGFWGSLLLGIILALSFCPESAIVFFGMLMPLSANTAGGYFLPVVFSIATSIPAVLLAWGLAYGISGTSVMREKMHAVQRWMTVVVGLLFVGAGVFCFFF